MKDIFLLVDGNSLLHRAYHALPLMDADGVYTNAIYGFLSMLLKVIREEKVQYLAVCFDEHAPTFRHTVYAEYKAGRSATHKVAIPQYIGSLRAMVIATDGKAQGSFQKNVNVTQPVMVQASLPRTVSKAYRSRLIVAVFWR